MTRLGWGGGCQIHGPQKRRVGGSDAKGQRLQQVTFSCPVLLNIFRKVFALSYLSMNLNEEKSCYLKKEKLKSTMIRLCGLDDTNVVLDVLYVFIDLDTDIGVILLSCISF